MFRNQKIFLLNSQEQDKLPENLENGELAVNNYAGHEFICLKNTDNQFVKITPNGGGGDEKKPWKLVEGKANSIVSEGNTSNANGTLTHGQRMHNDGMNSFAMGANSILLEYIEKNGKSISIPHEDTLPNANDYFIGAFIVDSEGNKLSDVVSASYNHDNEMDVLQLTNEIDTNMPLHIELTNNDGISNFNFGTNNKNSGNGHVTFGTYNSNTGYNNLTNGTSNVVNTNYNAVFGNKNESTAQNSLINGEGNINHGMYNIVSGYHNNVIGNYGAVVGSALKTKNSFESAFGVLNDCDSDNYIFTVGNGNETTRHNAFAISNKGEVFIQVKAKEEGEEYSEMVTIQSLIQRIKDLEAKYTDLRAKYDEIHL
nr:MAG TPA: YadA-like protein [Caudoviricetes sp.]